MAATLGTARPTFNALVRRLDWTLELLVLLLVVAETCVVYLVVNAAFGTTNPDDPTVSPLWLFLLLYGGTMIQRVMDACRLFSPEYEIVSLVVIAAFFLAAIRVIAYPTEPFFAIGWLWDSLRGLAFFDTRAARPIWGVVALVAYAWWRGRTRDDPSVESAHQIMRIGTIVAVVALLATFAVLPAAAESGLRRALFAAVITFLAAILAAIALGRLRIEHARGILTLTPGWLVTFLAPVFALVLFGTLLAGIFTRRFLDTLLWLLTPLFWVVNLILLIIVYIATGFAWVIYTIVAFLARFFGPVDGLPRPVNPTGFGTGPTPTDDTQALQTPDTVRYLGALILLALIGWVLTRFLWRRRRRRIVGPGEERESIFSWGLLAENWGDLINGLGGRFARKPDHLAHLRDDARWQHTVAIRELYGRFLRRGANAHLPRADDQTPDEYAPLVAAIGPPAPAVSALTSRYDDARYSAHPATAADAAAARAAWDTIEAASINPKDRPRS